MITLLDDFDTISKSTNIIVYGHSLGAACAVIVSYLLKQLISPVPVPVPVPMFHCYIIACPPVFKTGSPILNMDISYIHYYSFRDFAATTTAYNEGVHYGTPDQNIKILPGISFRRMFGKCQDKVLNFFKTPSLTTSDLKQIRDEHSLLTILKAKQDTDEKTIEKIIPDNFEPVSKIAKDQNEAMKIILIKLPYEVLKIQLTGMIRVCDPPQSGGNFKRTKVKLYILKRHRLIYLQGQIKYIKYNGKMLKLREARRLEGKNAL